MRIIFEYLPFGLAGAFIGIGPYIITDWQWWAMMVPLVVSISISQFVKQY